MATENDEMKAAAAALKTATDEVKSYAEKTTTELKNLGKLTDETKANADKAISEMNAVKARLDEMEQKASRKGNDTKVEAKGFGSSVVEGDEIKAALAQGPSFKGRARVELKAISNLTTPVTSGGTSGSTSLVVADRQGMVALPQYPLTIRNLIAPGNTSSNLIEYPVETAFDNSAATVAEGALKPQSDMKYGLANAPVVTLAHWVKASRQILADAPQLSSIVDQRLRYGVSYVEDQAFLMGPGTPGTINGLMPQATTYAAPAGVVVPMATRLDTLRLAILQATLALLPASGIVLHPTDWAEIELTKDGQGRYLFGNPASGAAPVVWNLPVSTSFAMPVGSFLTGAFRTAAQVFDREEVSVSVSTEDGDNFVRNMVTILCEERVALAVYRPAAFVKGTF